MRNPAFLGSFALGKAKKFTFKIVTSAPDTVFTLPLTLVGGYTHNFTVKWGDSSSSTITAYDDVDKAHTYSSAGTYEVEIKGICPGFKFNNGGSKLLITEVISWGNVYFRELNFFGCSNLTTLPEETGKLSLVTSFYRCFRFTRINPIPAGLFKGNTIASDFRDVFYESLNCQAVPSGLFDDNIAMANVTTSFYNTPQLTSIPSGLFDNNVNITNMASVFRLSRITSIPSGLFDNNINVTSFWNAFRQCPNLTSIPEGLFDNNTAVTTFNTAFYQVTNLTGLAPELWLRVPEPTGIGCFSGCTGLDNYGDIPADWK